MISPPPPILTEDQVTAVELIARPAVLAAEGVHVRYRGCSEAALHDVSLSIRAGERLLLLGPSGCGKTTLLRALEGSLPLESGSVDRSGRAALIYQDLRLVAEQTALKNVCSGALSRTRGVLAFSRETKAYALQLLADLGLAGFENKRVSGLSGGQRQRVAIARALCSRPTVLLADEPLASLDRANAQKVLTLLIRLQQKYGFALVLSVHNVALDPAFFDRALLVRSGRVHELMDEELEMAIEELSEPLTILAAEMPAPAIDGSKTEGPVEGLPLLKFAALPVLGVVVAVGLLGWALAAIDVRPLFQSEALNGMIQFAKELLPASLAEARALPWARLFASLLETIQMALIGTFAGIVLSLPLAILASRQSSPAGIRHAVRFGLNVIRTVPSIIWALVFVAAVGLGPLSGICALAIYSVGYLTKFFYEALENADDRPALALCALGATRLQSFMTAMLPASKPALIGACLFVFEYNIRSASVLGVVGAGGIGADLMYYIEWRNFPAAMAGLLLILVVVVALDGLSGLWRRRVGAQRGI